MCHIIHILIDFKQLPYVVDECEIVIFYKSEHRGKIGIGIIKIMIETVKIICCKVNGYVWSEMKTFHGVH